MADTHQGNGHRHRGAGYAAVYISLPGGDLPKSQIIVSTAFLQECVLSCKTHIALSIKQNTTKNYGFQSFDWCFQHKRLPYKKVHIVLAAKVIFRESIGFCLRGGDFSRLHGVIL